MATGKKSVKTLLDLTEKLNKIEVSSNSLAYVTDDINQLLHNTVGHGGLPWRLPWLNQSLGPLRKGNAGFLVARPETGKTTFLADQVTYMAEHLDDDAPPVLWFNNEEEGNSVKLRIVQAALGWRTDEIQSNPAKSQEIYDKVINHKIMLIDEDQITKDLIEKYVTATGASLIVVDQLDKVYGFKADRHDLLLGEIYRWFRELAKRTCPALGVCQADASAEGVSRLTMAHIAGSKTAKSGEADFIVGIGRQDQHGFENNRTLTIIKNKLPGGPQSVPEMRHGSVDVLLRPQIARYEEYAG